MGNRDKFINDKFNEDIDDAYCDFLYKEYLKDPDKGELISLEDLSQSLGINI